MSFEKTEKYNKELEAIRREPQNTAEEKQDKKEHAREFRMEVMLDNARLMQDLTAQLEYNPWATEKDLAESVQKSAEFLAHPEVAENFINDLIAAKKRVEDIAESRAEETKEPLAEIFYRDLIRNYSETHEYYEVKGNLTVDTSYPLAIILYVEDDRDFGMIDPGTNVGGFYQASKRIYNSVLGKNFEFPLIVIKGSKKNIVESGTIIVEEHEKGHAEHQRLMSTLKNMDIKNVWLKFKVPAPGKVAKLKERYFPSKHQRKIPIGWEHSEEDWNEVMDYALERAKDELLAEFKITNSLEYHVTNLLTKEGVYDYFKGLSIDPGTDLYNDLWKEYENKLRISVRFANHLLNAYKMFDLSERLDLMRWVLAQIPLRDWENQISKSAFWDEVNGLYGIGPGIVKRNREGLTKDGEKEFMDSIKKNQSHSLLPKIKEYGRTQL